MELKKSLFKKRFSILQVDTRDHAFSLLDQGECFLVFLELALPEQGGALLMEEIYQAYPDIPIVLVTTEESLDAAIRAIRCNVLDYIIKPADQAMLLLLVERAYSRYAYRREKEKIIQILETSIESLKHLYGVSPQVYHKREETEMTDSTIVDLERGVLIKDGAETALTQVERSLLFHFIENPGRVFSVDEVWHHLYKEPPGEGHDPRHLVRTNVSRLRKKLKLVNNDKDWVINVRGEGYTFEP